MSPHNFLNLNFLLLLLFDHRSVIEATDDDPSPMEDTTSWPEPELPVSTSDTPIPEGFIGVHNQDGHHTGALFLRQGTCFNGLSFGHITVPINLTFFRTEVDRYQQIANDLREHSLQIGPLRAKLTRQWSRENQSERKNAPSDLTFAHDFVFSQMNTFAEWIEWETNATRSKLDDVTNSITSEQLSSRAQFYAPLPTRYQRQIFAAIAGGIIGSIFSAYALEDLVAVVDQKEDLLAHQVESSMVSIHQTEEDIQRVNASLQVAYDMLKALQNTEVETQLSTMSFYTTWKTTESLRKISQLIDAVIAAHQGHFSDSIISSEVLASALTQLKMKANKQGSDLGVTTLLDCFSLPTSYLYKRDQGIFYIILHVPIYRIGEEMSLYKFIPTPILWTNGGQKLPFVNIDSPDTYIGLNRIRTLYKTYTTEELEDCLRIGRSFFCEDLSMYKNSRKSCLSSLINKDLTQVQETCEISAFKGSSSATRLNSTHYALFLPKQSPLFIQCQIDGELYYENSTYGFRGTTILELTPGCVAYTDEIKIERPSFEMPIEVQASIMGAPLTVDQIIPNYIGEDIEQMFQMRAKFGSANQKIAISQLATIKAFDAKYTKLKRTSLTLGIGFPSTTIMVILLTTLVIIGSCCCCNPSCRNLRLLLRAVKKSKEFRPPPPPLPEEQWIMNHARVPNQPLDGEDAGGVYEPLNPPPQDPVEPMEVDNDSPIPSHMIDAAMISKPPTPPPIFNTEGFEAGVPGQVGPAAPEPTAPTVHFARPHTLDLQNRVVLFSGSRVPQ